MLIWEPVIFFFIFWLIVDYIEGIFDKDFKSIIKYLFTFVPAVLIGVYIALNPMSEADHKNMAIFLKENFKPEDLVVVLFHDHGSRYLKKIYNDDWMSKMGYM